MSFTTDRRFAALEKLVLAAKALSKSDPANAPYLCQLACIQICGNIERCVELLLLERFEKRVPDQIPEFLKRYFLRGTNYDCDAIHELLCRFDGDWGKKFDTFVQSNSAVKNQISGAYGIRNILAHGNHRGLGYKQVQDYFDASKRLVAEIELAIR